MAASRIANAPRSICPAGSADWTIREYAHSSATCCRRSPSAAVRCSTVPATAATRRAALGDLSNCARNCLSGRGEASGVALAREILARYARTDDRPAHRVLRGAGQRFRSRSRAARRRRRDLARTAIRRDGGRGPSSRPNRAGRNCCAGSISRPAAPRRWCACASICSTRMDHRDDLAAVDADFVHLFSSWFNRGFLVLRRIDWSTPASVLEKIIRYEAVHRIRDWDDLRRRIDPPDRRCYAFFHPALVDEPLIFVEVALTREIPDARSRRSSRPTASELEPSARNDGGVLFDLQLPARACRRVVRQFPDQAGGRGNRARDAAALDLSSRCRRRRDFAAGCARERRPRRRRR